jgi:hypothetical protein
MGLLASAVTRSQIAAMFFAMIGTIIPATQFAGLIDPVSSLEGSGKLIGEIYPATHMITISRGVFSKALGLGDLTGRLLVDAPVGAGDSRRGHRAAQEAGALRCAEETSPTSTPGRQGAVEPVARSDDAGAHRLRVHRVGLHRRHGHARDAAQRAHRHRR